jgi:hypothetical protein
MSKDKKEFKNLLKIKFLEFEINGFEKYLKYLNQQLLLTEKKKNWGHYKTHILSQIEMYEEKKVKSKKKLSKILD